MKSTTHMPESLVWERPGKTSADSMPLGNGDLGLNVWVEEDGDLLFYLSKTDAWDENARLLKLGRIRVSLSPNPFVAGADFRQQLDVANGCIRIQSAIGNAALHLTLWVDANRPVVRLSIDSGRALEARVGVELWRTAERPRDGAEAHGDAGLRSPQERETVYPDTVLPVAAEAILWCHRNRSSCWAATLAHQDMAGYAQEGRDPLLGRTFGALLRGDGLVRDGDCGLRSDGLRTRIDLAIHPLTAQTATLGEWSAIVCEQADTSDLVDLEAAFAEHVAWWQAFWRRSWIHLWGTAEAEVVSRGYELQRFVTACAGRGAMPIKFNGSIFTVDAHEPKEVFDADYRRWGGGYWFQNTRLTYWPMIMAGDFDMLAPWFRMYLEALPLALARGRLCFGLDQAAMFPETMTFWGSYLNSNYGYARGDLPASLSENRYIRRYWQGMLELLAVLLDAYAVSEDEELLRGKLLVLAPPFLRFYREYYQARDADGKLLLQPSQSLETWHEAVNPTPDLAGLQWVLDGLLALPEEKLPAELRREWQEFRDLLPPLPTQTFVWEKRTVILPARQYDQCANSENPELYAVFPYRQYGVGKGNLEIGRATWAARRVKGTGGWRQDAIQAALLGLTEEAKAYLVENFSSPHHGSRFPAFWGPNFDWIPDQDHGSAACLALQQMLIQWDPPMPAGAGGASDGEIRLLPAWPKEWNVDFRLHAPGRTVVEGRVENGEVKTLRVTPDHRRQAIATDWPVCPEPAAAEPATPLMTNGELPPLLVFADGSPVRTAADWLCRRREVADAILDLEYGGMPPAPERTTVEELHTGRVPGIEGAKFRTCRIHVEIGPGASFSFPMTLLIPPGDGPFPVVLTGDACWRYAGEAVVAEVLARGMVLAQFNRVELAADVYTAERASGIYPLYPDLRFGALSAWAWGYHRCVDILRTMLFADASRIAVTGHSRGGKTVLLAGATDDRIALVGANNSGAGGAGCFRIQGHGSETLADTMRAISYWFGPGLPAYVGRENELPFDQHFLKALIAPRALLTSEALGDAWANPIGTWHTHQAASQVYRLLGVEDRLGIAFRPGGHQHGLADWCTFLDFMEWQLCGKPCRRRFDWSPRSEV